MKPWANMCSVNINPVSEEGLMTRVWARLYNQLRFRSRGDTEVMKCVSGAGTLLHNAIISQMLFRCFKDGHKNLSFSLE